MESGVIFLRDFCGFSRWRWGDLAGYYGISVGGEQEVLIMIAFGGSPTPSGHRDVLHVSPSVKKEYVQDPSEITISDLCRSITEMSEYPSRKNPTVSAIYAFLGAIENECLVTTNELLESDGFPPLALLFDGVLIKTAHLVLLRKQSMI